MTTTRESVYGELLSSFASLCREAAWCKVDVTDTFLRDVFGIESFKAARLLLLRLFNKNVRQFVAAWRRVKKVLGNEIDFQKIFSDLQEVKKNAEKINEELTKQVGFAHKLLKTEREVEVKEEE